MARLGHQVSGLQAGELDLASNSTNSLSAFYEAGSICSIYYPGSLLPSDEQLNQDLKSFIRLYFMLVSCESRLFEKADAEDDEERLGEEDLRTLREHKRVERNRKLAHLAKRHHGFACKACGFDFQAKYGSVGKGFIEAHHLTPLAELKGQKLTLDAKRDFTVLCSNCHRMIHKTAHIRSVEEFRSTCILG